MQTRDKIFSELAKNKIAFTELPTLDWEKLTIFENDLDSFCHFAKLAGAEIMLVNDKESLETLIRESVRNSDFVAVEIENYKKLSAFGEKETDKMMLEKMTDCWIEAEFGVAENGALWITETRNRLSLFATQQLHIVIAKEKLFSTMHHAYEAINWDNLGFGVFISGPSKTADIEQSLVIGAHGACSLRIYVM